ncbi:MAG: hypothetical protein KGJ02_04490 [Verrucomicrobiota bacterium]|nr:hypothetical protein [Verrucomicrobiota bacterium]
MSSTTLLGNISDTLSYPSRLGYDLAVKAIDSNIGCLETIGCSLSARLLFLAQSIVSLVALPFLLIATLFSALTTCYGMDRQVLDDAKGALGDHFQMFFVNLFSAIAPLECI